MYRSLRDAVVRVELAAVDGVLVVETLAGRVDLNELITHDGGGD